MKEIAPNHHQTPREAYQSARLYTFAHIIARHQQAERRVVEGDSLEAQGVKANGQVDSLFPITPQTLGIWDRMAARMVRDEFNHDPAMKTAAKGLYDETRARTEQTRQTEIRQLSELWNRPPQHLTRNTRPPVRP